MLYALAKLRMYPHAGAEVHPTLDFPWRSEDGSTAIDVSYINSQLNAFFNTIATGATHRLSQYMSYSVDMTQAFQVETYDLDGHLDGTPHGSPVDVQTHAWTDSRPSNPSNLAMPESLAAVCHYRSNYGTDTEFGPGVRPRARHRGRLYLGPLNYSVGLADSTYGYFGWTTAFTTDVTAALAQLGVAGGTGSQTKWSQWSRVGAVMRNVDFVGVDVRSGVRRRRNRPAVFIG